MRTKYWFLGASALLAAAPSPAVAAYCYFQGSDGGSWSSAGNWGCGKLPVAGDDVVLANWGTVNHGAITSNFKTLYIGSGTTLNASGGTMRVGDYIALFGYMNATNTVLTSTSTTARGRLLQDGGIDGAGLTLNGGAWENSSNIYGWGSIGTTSSQSLFLNNGMIEAGVAGKEFVINPLGTSTGTTTTNYGWSGTAAFQNNGRLNAINGGKIRMTDGRYSNTGQFYAGYASTFTMDSGAVLENVNAGKLTGGTYYVEDSGTMALRGLTTAAVTELAGSAQVYLGRGSSVFTINGTALTTSLRTIRSGSQLYLDGGRAMAVGAGTFTNEGSITLSGGAFTATSLDLSGSFTGYGNINATNLNILYGDSGKATLRADGGTLKLTGTNVTGNRFNYLGASYASTLDISSLAGDKFTDNLSAYPASGGLINIGSGSITVTTDFYTDNFSYGTFNPRAGIIGTGAINALSATQTLTAAGTATLTDNVLNLGGMRVGTFYNALNIANQGTSTYLRGSMSVAGGSNLVISGGTSFLVAAGTNRTFQFRGQTAGSLNGQTLNIANNFDNVDDASLTLQGAVYQVAAAQAQPLSIALGPQRKGSLAGGGVLTVRNTATDTNGYTEGLAVRTTTTGGFLVDGQQTGTSAPVAAQQNGVLSLSHIAQVAGEYAGTIALTNVSKAFAGSGLSDLTLNSQTINVTGTVTETAVASLSKLGGAGDFAGSGNSFTLDLGSFDANSGSVSTNFLLQNAIGDFRWSEILTGAFSLAGGEGFSLSTHETGLLRGGNISGDHIVSFDTAGLGSGTYQTVLTFNGVSRYTGLQDLSLAPITVRIQAVIAAAVPEPATWAMMIAGFGMAGGAVRRSRKLALQTV